MAHSDIFLKIFRAISSHLDSTRNRTFPAIGAADGNCT